MRGWWEQAARQAAAVGQTRVLIWRQDRDEWRAVMPTREASTHALSMSNAQ
ncbi:putative PDDEXK endonuclease [Cupriavidus taiwanensis]|uniref:putative PDDEXK endonuclease n=1 Tax=Cupriavidus taiwanensis TaxID=164546 RepID=UPI003D176E33